MSYQEQEGTVFTPSLDRIIHAARLRMTGGRPSAEPDLDAGELDAGVDMLEQEARRAVAWLRGPDTVRMDDPDEVIRRLAVLDMAAAAACYADETQAVPAATARRLYDLEYTAMAVPMHRLIPLNEWRRRMRDGLTDEAVARMPWYDVWANEDEHLLDDIMMALPELARGDFSMFEEQDRKRMRLLFDEIGDDPPLMHRLQRERTILLEAMRVLASDPAARLFRLAETAHGPELPPAVAGKGLDVCLKKISRLRPDNEREKAERRFLTAFSAPGIPAGERMEIFEKTAAFVKDTAPAHGILARMREWLDGRLGDGGFAREVVSCWNDLLENTVRAEEHEVSSRFHDFMERIKAGSRAAMFDFRKAIYDLVPQPAQAAPAYADASTAPGARVVEACVVRFSGEGQQAVPGRATINPARIHDNELVLSGTVQPELPEGARFHCLYEYAGGMRHAPAERCQADGADFHVRFPDCPDTGDPGDFIVFVIEG